MSGSEEWRVGDLVFAKIRGHPFWPGRIDDCNNGTTAQGKFKIFLFGTYETAWCHKKDPILGFNKQTKEKFQVSKLG